MTTCDIVRLLTTTEGNVVATLNKLIGIADVQSLTGIAQETIRYHLEQGDWPGVRIGRKRVWRIPPAVADCLLAGRDPGELKRPTQ
jgi:hypothetical protein